jgi:LmbE family N-acetylglucosaminyl deacetylase
VTASPSTAAHLADIDARYDAHLAALRQHAAQLQAGVARGAAEPAERVAPDSEPSS